jgi:hypothetical protein
MYKRILLIFLVLVAVFVIVGGYFYLQRGVLSDVDPFSAIADDAVIVIRVNDIQEFFSSVRSGSEMWEEIGVVLDAGDFFNGIVFGDSIIAGNPEINEISKGRHLFLSLHPSGRDKYEAVYYFNLASFKEAKNINGLVEKLLPEGSVTEERVYNRARIYDATLRSPGSGGGFSWTVQGGLFIFSNSSLLIENAVDQLLSGDGLPEDEAFRKVYGTTGTNVDANVFFNLRHLPGYISSFTGEPATSLLKDFDNLASWAELDFHLRDDALLMNGFSFSESSENSYLNIFEGQSPVNIKAISAIPSFTSGFLAIGLSDPILFHENYLDWLEGSDRMTDFAIMEETFFDLTGLMPAEAFHSVMTGEIALVMTGWDSHGTKGETFLMIDTRSRSLSEELMLQMLAHNARITGNSIDSYIEVYHVDRETAYNIYSFPYSRTGEMLFGRIFGLSATSYFTFVDNYLVFGESIKGLSGLIHANVLNQTLGSDNRFNDFSEFLVSHNNFYLYTDLARSAGILSNLLNERLTSNLGNNPESLRRFQAFSLQFSAGREMIYNNSYLRYSSQVFEEPRTEWQTLLDTLIDFKPVLLQNHNTGENEIIVQDLNNNIYLINNAGRILWKKPLPGRIMGTVHQIDLYKNGRLQMIFNTAERIYLIDRNGNDVGRYPVRLPSPATTGISVFDYDNNRDYRIFVAAEDRSVVVRSGEGNVVTGWNFRETEHNVYHEIQHIRSDGRDYIVFGDRHRVYILDRRGNARVKPDNTFPVSVHNNIIYEGRTPSSDPRLTLTDTTGGVWHIYFDGRTQVKRPGNYSSEHFFDFNDVNADGYNDYIFIDEDRLDVYSSDGSSLFSHEFTVPIDHAPSYYYFSREDRKIGVVSRSAGQIFLFNSNGGIYNGFPLQGRSYFTIGFLQSGQGNFHLLVGSPDNFLFNYIVY